MNALLPIASVAVDGPLNDTLAYTIPEHLSFCAVGARVKIPLGKAEREVMGCVMQIDSEPAQTPPKDYALKPLLTVLDTEPLFPTALLDLFAFVARYYHHPIGSVLWKNVPQALRKGRSVTECLEKRSKPRKYTWQTDTHPHNPVLTVPPQPALTVEQQAVYDTLQQHPADTFLPYLLFGITGSGKTRIYTDWITQRLASGGQCLMLIPEIGLTPQVWSRFVDAFPDKRIAVYHSGLTPDQKLATWFQAWQGAIDIVIGTRSAVFLPMPHLRAIAVDEEHDPSFKQQEGLRYNARDLALYRAKHARIPIVLGSGTPSLESYAHAQSGKYRLLRLQSRPLGQTLPSVTLLNICKKPLIHGLAPESVAAIRDTVQAGRQVLVFINRRGYAPLTICHTCGTILECPACDAYLTWHAQAAWLICHHCQRKIHHGVCPACQADNLVPTGYGTERLEADLGAYFEQPVLRFDRDTLDNYAAYQKALDNIYHNRVSLIVGTQMLAKGHHFPHVSLVICLDVDQRLCDQSLKGSERLAQLLVQVSGRAGRSDIPGHVILQTHSPKHPLLQSILQDGYGPFADHALPLRKHNQLPPYTYSALIYADAKHPAAPERYLHTLQSRLAQWKRTSIWRDTPLTCWGPAPPRMARLAHYHRMQLWLNTPHRRCLHACLDYVTEQAPSIRIKRTVRTHIEVDPEEI